MSGKHHYAQTIIRQGLLDGLTSFAELESRISALPSTGERGEAFEAFAEAYLATQKIAQAEYVWPGQHIPIEVLRTHKLPSRDLGADGVFRTWSGALNAYQVKFRTGRPSLTWEELATFMALTDQVDQRVLFTNCDVLAEVMSQRSGFYCIRGSDLDRLTEADFSTMRDWLRSGQVHHELRTPDPHQVEAVTAIAEGLLAHDRVTTIMACGTGKTMVALWTAEKTGYQRIVVLVPSLALIRQTLHEWLKETRWERPRFLCVCSDPTVAPKNSDEVIVHQQDLDFPVTTDPTEVRAFMSNDGVRVVFTTYQSSKVVGAALEGAEGFDLGIFDEAHKTAGREGTNFAFALRDENLRIGKRVFMTATPRHYDIRHRDKEGEAKLVYSMDKPETYGPVVYTLSFAEAARRGIICDYRVIISVVTSKMINDDLLRHGEVIVEGDVVKARQVAHQIALKRACEAHYLRRVITFHSRVKTAREFTGEGGQSVGSQLPDFRAFHVSGEMRTADREILMTAFRQADRAIMSNARCLTEGVDVPTVDMVAFMAPKKSKVDIVQAVGRAMRKVRGSDRKTLGYVMVPLYVEMASGETIEEALARTDFDDVWDVLQALQEEPDSVLAEIIRELRTEQGRTGGFDDNRTRERVEVLGPQIALEDLRRSITAALIERLGFTWDERFGELQRYKEVHGDCRVPARWPENPQLGAWVANQRTRKGQLSAERIGWLDALGFDWDPIGTNWEAMFTALQSYQTEHGDCRVPARWPENLQLAAWVGNQRSFRARGELSAERIERLEKLGFQWEVHESDWEAMFKALQRYQIEHGDCRVPVGWPENPQLGSWVGTQRTAKAKGKLSAERMERLEKLGFEWDPINANWEEMFAKLEGYKAEHGDCRVPDKWAVNPQLGAWVTKQRMDKARGELSGERTERLEKLEFEWDPFGANWEAMFKALQSYQTEHGDCRVPQEWPENPQLGKWVTKQRLVKAKNKLSAERIERLEKLGFEWDPIRANWEVMFTALEHYRAEHGDCRVPNKWPENLQLAAWVGNQRAFRARGELSAERIERLTKLGFEWDVHGSDWEAMFAKLEAYKAEHGDCRVPTEWPENPQLGAWVVIQRSSRAKGKLSAERTERLTKLGFEWDPFGANWEAMFAKLEGYKAEHGDCRVPTEWPENPQLASWVVVQRTFRSKGKLSADRIERLTKLGFEWDPRGSVWEEMFAKLEGYKAEHGDCRVLKEWSENPQLGAWVALQRMVKAKGKLSAERIERLERLGFEWDPRGSDWEAMFKALQRYRAERGDCRVPDKWAVNPQLGAWVTKQRRQKEKDKLSAERIERLKKLGFEWTLRSRRAPT